MFKKTLTATVAALTLAGATLTTTQSAQAGSLGAAVVAGVVGIVVGVVAGAASSRANTSDDYRPAYRPVRGEYEGGYRQVSNGYVRGGYEAGCGFKIRPVFDEYGNKVGVRKVPAC